MRNWLVIAFVALVTGCATAPPPLQPDMLFRDTAFAPQFPVASVADVFALSAPMRRYLETEVAREARAKGRIHGLVDALYTPGQLRLEYDAAYTRTAREAFEARAGNCLSLVIMTAAFAREMGLPVRFQNVYTEETWTRAGNVLFASGHVNLVMGSLHSNTRTKYGEMVPLTIDFIRPDPDTLQRAWEIGEDTIVSMFMNNRAAEALARGDTRTAYWWARAAVLQDAKFFPAYNTLGVVYRRHGDLEQAERVFQFVLAREPGNVNVMSNLAVVMESQGRGAEAARMAREVERLRPFPPFHFFDLGMAAMKRQDYREARDQFLREIDRAAYQPEFHFWLGAAYVGLNDFKRAQKHLAVALENSTTQRDHQIYAAKLDWIRAKGS